MRFPTAYYLMLLYITVMLKPLIPYISDAVSHTFEDAMHIATVHSVYGDNHVEIEMATSSSDENNKNQNTSKGQEPIPVHVSEVECNYLFTLNTININYNPVYSFNLKRIIISRDAPPPRLV